MERKKQLDQIMREYYYEKNDIDTTIEFLVHMYHEYVQAIKNIKK